MSPLDVSPVVGSIAEFAFNLLVLVGALVVIVPVALAVLVGAWLAVELLIDGVRKVRQKRAEQEATGDA